MNVVEIMNVVELHTLATAMKGRVVKLNTDSCVVEDGVVIDCLDGIGNDRQEKLPECYNASREFQNGYSFNRVAKKWNEWDAEESGNYSR